MKVEGGITGGWNAGAVPAGQGGGGDDTVGKNLKKQIESAQNELKSVSQNKDMPPEEKMERSKRIRQEIADLKRQLTQHQVERQKEQREQRTEQRPKQKPAEKTEIQLDGGRRGSIGLKEKELAQTENNISNLEGKIGGRLGETVKQADETGAEVKQGQRKEEDKNSKKENEEERAGEDKSLISGIGYYKKIDVFL